MEQSLLCLPITKTTKYSEVLSPKGILSGASVETFREGAGAQRAISFQNVHQLRANFAKIVVCALDKTHFRDFKKPRILTANGRLLFLL